MMLIALAIASSIPRLPDSNLANPSPFPSKVGGKGAAFLAENSKRAYQYFIDQSDPKTGLTKDRARNFEGDSSEHSVASIAATGYALTAYAIGVQRGWMTRTEALRRTKLVLTEMERQYRKDGWYYHWLSSKTGEREWRSEISTIDSALLFYGMIVARQGLKDRAIDTRVDKILAGVDFRSMMTDGGSKPESLTINMGWRPEQGYLDARWDHYFENWGLNILALGLDSKVPDRSWDAMTREIVVGEGIPVITGGTAFMHQMSHGYIDFRGMRDRLGYDYWVDGRNMTLSQSAYCAANPMKYKGYSREIWGLSACDDVQGYGGGSYPGNVRDTGTLAPPAALASMIFTPELSTASAEAFYKQYPGSYGRYGFSSGINPTVGWKSPDMIGIDQGQAMVNIENARDGVVQKLFMSYAPVRRGMTRAGFRKTEEGSLEKRALHRDTF